MINNDSLRYGRDIIRLYIFGFETTPEQQAIIIIMTMDYTCWNMGFEKTVNSFPMLQYLVRERSFLS